MAKFEQSRFSHEVHHIAHPQGHGLQDQKHDKGMRSPIVSALPNVESGSVAEGEAGAPGEPSGEYGASDNTGS